MQEKINSSITSQIGRIDEVAHPDEPVEWWYFNSVLSVPGSPIDGWAFVTIFTIFRNIADNVHGLLIPPDGDPVDMSGYELTPGAISFNEKIMDVSWSGNSCHGKYPSYTVHFDGADKSTGKNYAVDLEIKCDISPGFFTYSFGNSKLNHFVVFRTKAAGKVTLNGILYDVNGIGYFEHFFGFLDLTASRGWYWYGSSGTIKHNMAVNIGMGVMRDNSMPCRFIQFSPEGKDIYSFENFDFQPMEEKDFDGVKYVSKFLIKEKNSSGEMECIISRNPSAYKRMNQSTFGPAIFVTGFASQEGYIKWKNKEYDLKSNCIGSAMLFDLRF